MFNKLSETSGKYANEKLKSQYVQDILLVVNILVQQKVEDPNFQIIEVLTVEAAEKASDAALQIECANLEKTETALAKFHAENLCHLQPDLRPDKFQIEL